MTTGRGVAPARVSSRAKRGKSGAVDRKLLPGLAGSRAPHGYEHPLTPKAAAPGGHHARAPRKASSRQLWPVAQPSQLAGARGCDSAK